ncbi:MAG: hypothetical protein IT320_03560 [Anaerolineae bacterium]|nr:hypothetical protein [Anaerolineae bacterium]
MTFASFRRVLPITAVLACLVILLSLSGGVSGQTPIKIMPLGDLITQGTTEQNSYRRTLWYLLDYDGYAVDFVGSQNGNYNLAPPPETLPPPNPDFDLDHEGHFTAKANDILAGIPTWASAAQPDIVLLHIGSLDLAAGETVDSTINEISQIIDALRVARPDVKILLAQIIPKQGIDDATLDAFNASIAALAVTKTTAQSPIVLVDQATGFSLGFTLDGTLPNDYGEAWLAVNWYDALTTVLPDLPTLTPFLTPTLTLTPSPTATPLPTNTPTPTATATPDARLRFETAVPESVLIGTPQPLRAVRPADESIVDTIRPTFEWRLATGERTYRLQVDNDRTFLSPVIERVVEGGLYTIPNREDGLPQGIYFWRVAPEGSEAWTDVLSFTVFIGKRPADESYTPDQTPRFTWAYVPNVSEFIFQLSRNTNFTDLVIDANVGPATAFAAPDELPYGIYYWRVFPLGDPPFANVHRTLAVSPPPPPPPNRVEAPEPGSTIGELDATFAWAPVDGAASYEIEIDQSFEFDAPFMFSSNEPTFTMADPIARGIYVWRVRSLNEYGVGGAWTLPQSFLVERPASAATETPTATPTATSTATPDGSSG